MTRAQQIAVDDHANLLKIKTQLDQSQSYLDRIRPRMDEAMASLLQADIDRQKSTVEHNLLVVQVSLPE